MERDHRATERRRPDNREHRARYQDRDRSRSPPHHGDRRNDDRRRDRSPYRGTPRNSAPKGHRQDDDRDFHSRGRRGSHSPPPHRNSRQPDSARGSGRAPPTGPRGHHQQHGKPSAPAAKEVNMDPLDGEDEEAYMQRIMGFGGFRSTKNTKVPGNDRNYGVNKVKKAEYRQYMNRVGGFNRPLSPSRG